LRRTLLAVLALTLASPADVDSTAMFYASVGFVWGGLQGEDVLEYQTFGNIVGQRPL
jgi:hypothetical protein